MSIELKARQKNFKSTLVMAALWTLFALNLMSLKASANSLGIEVREKGSAVEEAEAYQATDLKMVGRDQRINAFFGEVQLNFPAIRSWSISNSGDEAITLTRFVISGMAFSATTDCPKVMSPKTVCSLSVRFSPFSAGYHSAALDMIFDKGGNIYFDLWGYGAQNF